MRRIRILLIASILGTSAIALGPVLPVAASCATTALTLYVDTNGGGGGAQDFCTDVNGNVPNMNNIPGPCPQFLHADSWNDCVSSVRVRITATQCYQTFSNASYNSLMATYWGPKSDNLYNVSPNDAMSSFKSYSKSPATPAGNC